MGNGSVRNIARISAGTDGSVTLDEVEVEVGGRRPRDGGGGSAAASANNIWGVIFVPIDVDGAASASRRGISFGGYEERSYRLTSLSVGGGMIDTRLRADSSQHRSSIDRSCGFVLRIISLASSNVSFRSLASFCSVTISCSLSDRHNTAYDGRPGCVVSNLRCCCLIEAKSAASALRWALQKCC